MARSPYVWGIDIGKAALKALRCRPGDGPRKLVVDSFDYIEYPQFLSQSEADAPEIVRNALAEFTGRHKLAGDTVAVSVPGQLGLTKFIKLPPIEVKKIPDIVKYEARQQIPFPLEQVVWSWQRLAGGIEESGFAIDAEVALFAMKSNDVDKSLAPLIAAGVHIDILQLAPIALANLAMFDLLPAPSEIDPDSPPPSIVLVSMGVDSTDLVVTNGLRVWQRSMSIGGNSFTKALVKDQRLTFARAEELKCNAVRAEDPKAVYTSMRPVFDEFAVELQRSLSYFTSTDRTAEIGKVFMLGNAAGLRGLSDYVGKQLQLPTRRLELFQNLDTEQALQKPAFRDNRLAFGTTYGLAIQAAGQAGIRTSLLPQRIIVERKIDAKRPWAVAAILSLLVAGALSFVGGVIALSTFDEKLYAEAFREADKAKSRSQSAAGSLDAIETKQREAVARQEYVLAVQSRRFQTLDMMRAIESLLPHDPPGEKEIPIADRRELYIEKMDCQFFPDLAAWFANVQDQWKQTHPAETAADRPAEEGNGADGLADHGNTSEADSTRAPEGDGRPDDIAADSGPQGAGWVIELAGHHFHNEPHHKPNEATEFLRSTLIQNLLGEGPQVVVSGGPRAGETVSVDALGIGYPVIVLSSPVRTVRIATGAATNSAGESAPRPRGRPDAPIDRAADEDMISLRRYDFVVQFVWQPRTPGKPIVAEASGTEGADN